MCRTRLNTLNEVGEKFLDFTLAGNDAGFESWLRRETLAAQCAAATEPQDKCNCNIGCGDHHAAQCAVWIDPDTRRPHSVECAVVGGNEMCTCDYGYKRERCKDCDVTIEFGVCDCISKGGWGA